MRRVIIALLFVSLASTAFASDDRYEIRSTPNDNSLSGSREIEMRKKYDYDPSNKYRGDIESDGSVRMRNYNGDILRGYIDKDGYGRLRDQDGNIYRVKPR